MAGKLSKDGGISMTRLQCAILASTAALCAFTIPALAQSQPHFQVRMVPHSQSAKVDPNVAPLALFPLWQAFTTYAIDPNTGVDEWPCSGGQPECATINPLGLVVGDPAYIWSLTDCNATSTSTPNCGQTETWYEDNTNDTTDDLIYSLVARQGKNYIYDSGTVDFGVVYVGAPFPHLGGLISDSNFGTMGETGENNGNCYASYNYPYPTLPGYFTIAANQTCSAPIAGPVSITATTALATPTWKYKNGVPYEVTFTIKHGITQEWTIYLQ